MEAMTLDDVQSLCAEIRARGWQAEKRLCASCYWDKEWGRATREGHQCFHGVHIRRPREIVGTTIYSREQYVRLFCPDDPNYDDVVARDALVRLPFQSARVEIMQLHDGSLLDVHRIYTGNRRGVVKLTGGVSIIWHPGRRINGYHANYTQRLRAGWTNEQFTDVVKKVLDHWHKVTTGSELEQAMWRDVLAVLKDTDF